MQQVNIERIQMPDCWKKLLYDEFTKPYFAKIKEQYIEARSQGITIYPPANEIFNAFVHTPFENVRVVLLGQDPYHGTNQAMGLSFSVRKGVPVPPSLKTMFQELQQSLAVPRPQDGDLTPWAKQGILLLNSCLTVEADKPNSHRNWGWNIFTDAVIETVSAYKEHCIFLLWGAFARSKRTLIDVRKHTILESPHPSPLARGGFIGNGHFKKVNAIFAERGEPPIQWDTTKYSYS